MTAYRVAVIPGDGIGTEVMPAGLRVLEAAGERFGVDFAWTHFDWSCEYYREHGRMMPDDGLDQLRGHDAIFLGAVGHPEVPDHVSLWGLLIPIRRTFSQYVNLRPVRLFDGVASPLRDPWDGDGAGGVGRRTVDIAVVRENVEGEYSQIGGRLYTGEPEEIAVQQATFTRRGVERVMRYAFELARTRRGALASATKSNGIIHTMPFWDEIFAELAADYPDVETSQYHIDALAAAFVLRPERFDVVVGSNLFGDILSDLGAAVAGSIGIAPSANLDPSGRHPSMFEPVHGSAPDIAGQGLANPIGQIWSGAMLLDHLGHPQAGAAVVAGIERVLADTDVRTGDLGGTATTEQVTEAVLAAL